jgi:hypothetical protein
MKQESKKDITELKAASHSEVSNLGSDVDGFTVKKTTQKISNPQNKNETNTTTTFTIEHDKFEQLLFFTANMTFINLLVNTLCVEFSDQLKSYYIKKLHACMRARAHTTKYLHC